MRIINSTKEENLILDTLSKGYNSYSEMTISEQRFLNSLILRHKPNKILELGVAAGSSSVLILNAIKNIPNSRLISVDYNENWYHDTNKKSGFIVDNYPELKNKWKIYRGGLASNFLEDIGNDIDFCFIDTKHSLPGELLDFLIVLPFLNKNAVIVIHDINLHTWYYKTEVSNNMLISAISGEKLLPDMFENKFYHNTQKQEYNMFFPNIAGCILDENQNDKVWDVFNLLTQEWGYLPTDEDIESINHIFNKYYRNYYIDMFRKVLDYQSRKIYERKQQDNVDPNEINTYISKITKLQHKIDKYKFISKLTFGKLHNKFKFRLMQLQYEMKTYCENHFIK